MKRNLRNLWSRMPLTRADVQILHGVLRQMVRWKERAADCGDSRPHGLKPGGAPLVSAQARKGDP
jgi:tRNA C32,U32 (ribose-2'-O)-methylase TrmJ